MEPFEDSFKYWKEGNEMHVPKRKLDDIILYRAFENTIKLLKENIEVEE